MESDNTMRSYSTLAGALLTTALIMRALDRPRYHETTLDNLAKLHAVDPNRTGYYADLADKWRIEHKLQQWIDAGPTTDGGVIDLTGATLGTLHYDQYLCIANAIRLDASALRAAGERKLREVYAACGVKMLRV